MKTKIHVNQHIIRSNRKKGLNEPVFTVKQGKSNRYADKVVIDGPSELVYSPEKNLYHVEPMYGSKQTHPYH